MGCFFGLAFDFMPVLLIKKKYIMARVNGLVKIEGTIEDLTFYKKDGENFVRRKGGVSKERIASDPNFVRTRENNTEFGHCGSSGKLLRKSLGSMVFKAKDGKLSSRLVQVMSRVKNADLTSARGKRRVSEGIASAEGKLHLTGFDFNSRALFKSVLFAPFDLDTTTGTLSIPDFKPAEHLSFPPGATHVSIMNAVMVLDFETEETKIEYSPVVNLPLNLVASPVSVAPATLPSGTGQTFYVAMLSFYQEINGMQYSLKNEEFNVLTILEIL